MRFLTVLSILTVLCGCHSPNPHPELGDPIYLDIERDLKASAGAVQSEEKNLEDLKKALKDIKPQTGQIKYAMKKIYDSEGRLVKLRQINTYLQLRLDTRAKEDGINYLRAFEKDIPWPDPNEYKTYMSYKNMQLAPRAWNPKERIEAAKIKKQVVGHGGGHEEAAPSEHH
jgi:hypothetical protein